MERFALLLIAMTTAGTASGQQPVSLSLKGDVKIIKVDVTRIVKEDVRVVQTLPVTVTAPSGAALYFWALPPGVQGRDKNDTLEVTTAPNGIVVIDVKAVSADLDKEGKFKSFVTTSGSITFYVGEGPPPSPMPAQLPADQDLAALTARINELTQRIAALERGGGKPAATVTATVKHFTFVGAETDAKTRAVYDDPGLKVLLESASIVVHTEPSQSVGFTKAIKAAGGPPCVVLQDKDGNVIAQGPLASVREVSDLVRQFLRKGP